MKVKDLIELLSECPENSRVTIEYWTNETNQIGWIKNRDIDQVKERLVIPYGKARKKTIVVLS